MMKNVCTSSSNFLYLIEEEDLIINEKEIYRDRNVTVYESEYLDLKAEFILYSGDSQLNLNRDVDDRIKASTIFYPSALGLCDHSAMGLGLVLEKVRGDNVFSLVYNNELSFPQKVELIHSLINLVDFSNSRSLHFCSLSLRDLVYDVNTEKLCVVKYPLFIIDGEKDVNDLINSAPESISLTTNGSTDNSWNLGLLIYEILESHHFIFSKSYNNDSNSIKEKIQSLDNNHITQKLNSLPYNQYIKNILKKLLKINPKQRSSAKLIKQTFNKSLILESHLLMSAEKSLIRESKIRKEKEMMSLNQSNFYLNESAYPMNNEASLMEISKELNFNVTINCNAFERKNQSGVIEEIEVDSRSCKEICDEKKEIVNDKSNLSCVDNNERTVGLTGNTGNTRNIIESEDNHAEITELAPNNLEDVEKIFENPNKKQSCLNFFDNEVKNDTLINDTNHENTLNMNNMIIPICGEINKEGENFIQFEEKEKVDLLVMESSNCANVDINTIQTSLQNLQHETVNSPNNSSYLSQNSSHSLHTEMSILFNNNKQERNTIERLEEIANNYQLTNSEGCMRELEEMFNNTNNNTNCNKLRDAICSNEEQISSNLWDSFMCLAFNYLENDDIKAHYNISSILYSTVDKVYPVNTITYNNKLALAKFHYGKSMKDYSCNYSLALNLFSESLQLLKKINEEDSKIGVQVKFFLGSLYDDMGMSEESIETLREVLKKQIEIYTEEHTFTARTYNCLGIAEDNRGNYKQAKEYYQKAYMIFKNLSFGLETVDCAKVLNNLAGIYYKWEDYISCIKFYTKVLQVYQNKYGEDNSSYVAITYYNLGNCFYIMNSNDKAEEYLKKSLDIFTRELGPSHPKTAMSLKTLGDLYFSLDNNKLAYDMYSQCVNTFLEKYGDDNDLYISTANAIKKIKLGII